MHSLLASQLAVLSFVPALVSAAPWTVGNAVKLDSGPVIQGHASSWQPSVSEYLGIPFAEPPIGPLRFAAPKPWKSGPGTFLASKFSPSCPANVAGLLNATEINSPKGVILASLGQFGDAFDEDCLTVNIWTKPQSGEKAKAVLAWIYVSTLRRGEFCQGSF
jgi:cholinesterase